MGLDAELGGALVPPVDGIVTFQAAKRRWRILFGVNALCRLEAEVDDEAEIRRLASRDDGDPKIQTIRVAFWAGLQEHHPDLTFEDAGNLMDRVGLVKAGQLLSTAMIAGFPPPEGQKPGPWKAALRRLISRA